MPIFVRPRVYHNIFFDGGEGAFMALFEGTLMALLKALFVPRKAKKGRSAVSRLQFHYREEQAETKLAAAEELQSERRWRDILLMLLLT